MGSTIGSILQGIGSTGEDVGKADINNQVMQHQFTMDYLANQARNRQLDLDTQRLNTETGIQHSQLQLQYQQQQIENERYNRQGMTYAGTTRDASGNYNKVYQNPLKPEQSISIPFPSGEVPIDSPEGQARASQILQSHGISKEDADKKVFGITPLSDPVAQVASLIETRGNNDPKFKAQPYANQLNWATKTYSDMVRGTKPLTMADLMAGVGGSLGNTPSGQSFKDIIADEQGKLDSGDLLLKDTPASHRSFYNTANLPPQITPAEKVTLGAKKLALTNTLDLIDRIEPDLDLLSGIPKASLVDLASNPDGWMQAITTRSAAATRGFLASHTMSAADKAKDKDDQDRMDRLAGNIRSLNTSINAIREPLGVTMRGGTGPAYENLVSQGLNVLGQPGVNKQVLSNTRGFIQGMINNLDVGMKGDKIPATVPPPTKSVSSPTFNSIADIDVAAKKMGLSHQVKVNGSLVGYAKEDGTGYTPISGIK